MRNVTSQRARDVLVKHPLYNGCFDWMMNQIFTLNMVVSLKINFKTDCFGGSSFFFSGHLFSPMNPNGDDSEVFNK